VKLIKKLLKSGFEKLGYRVQSTKYILKPFLRNVGVLALDFDHVISKYLIEKGDPNNFRFIQVGAYDGVECDPLKKYLERYDWEGILLEPQPKPYESLRRRYEGRERLKIVNAAVNRQPGKSMLYHLEGDDLPTWAKGLASFSKANILKHEYLVDNLLHYLKQIEVESLTFEFLLNKFEWKGLDLLQVDAEGFDAEIIRMFPLHNIKPAIIHFESKHIPIEDLELLAEKLINSGYAIAYDREEDMMAVLQTHFSNE
jgi:FkbM family methyltransferase